jgi:hypothetical protein
MKIKDILQRDPATHPLVNQVKREFLTRRRIERLTN